MLIQLALAVAFNGIGIGGHVPCGHERKAELPRDVAGRATVSSVGRAVSWPIRHGIGTINRNSVCRDFERTAEDFTFIGPLTSAIS
jgi:hypothetical protein